MKYNITSGKTAKGTKIVLYGVEGIGKTTLASKMPGAVFIDTEGSTARFDMARYPTPSSWEMLLDEIKDAGTNPQVETLVIDSGDWAEKMCVSAVCARGGKRGIEDFGYGQGYSYATEEYARMLNVLSDVAEKGKNVTVVLHAAIRQFTNPEEMGQYNRYTLELIDTPKCSNAAAVKQWADVVLFANYKDYIVEDDKSKKKYAQGGERVLYTQRTPAWDAKNRDGLPPVIPMDINALTPLFNQATATASVVKPKPAVQPKQVENTKTEKVATPEPKQKAAKKQADQAVPAVDPELAGVPQSLVDLMAANNVTPAELRKTVASKNYFPEDMPINTYPVDFIESCLVPAWSSQVMPAIEAIRSTGTLAIDDPDLPF